MTTLLLEISTHAGTFAIGVYTSLISSGTSQKPNITLTLMKLYLVISALVHSFSILVSALAVKNHSEPGQDIQKYAKAVKSQIKKLRILRLSDFDFNLVN